MSFKHYPLKWVGGGISNPLTYVSLCLMSFRTLLSQWEIVLRTRSRWGVLGAFDSPRPRPNRVTSYPRELPGHERPADA